MQGKGLGLTPKARGRHVAFVAGTGILPMLDLVAFIYRKVFFEMGMPLVRNEGMREFSNDFELYLIATFRRQDEALGLDFCKKLTEVCAARNKSMFQFEVRFVHDEENRKRVGDGACRWCCSRREVLLGERDQG